MTPERLEEPRERGHKMTSSRLLWFEVSRGHRLALRILVERLGFWGLIKILPRFLWLSIFASPLARLPKSKKLSKPERLSRRQFEPVAVLYEVLPKSLGLSREQSLDIIAELVSRSGAAFIAFNMGSFFANRTLERWNELDMEQQSATSDEIMGKFFNMTAARVRDETAAFAFEVSHCHFARMAKELGKPELAGPFCQADSVYFNDPRVPIELDRPQTLAGNGTCCHFRFSVKSPETNGPREPKG